jgi:hypothetical protein
MTRKPYLLIREDGTAEGERVIPYPTIDLALKAFGKVTRNAPCRPAWMWLSTAGMHSEGTLNQHRRGLVRLALAGKRG